MQFAKNYFFSILLIVFIFYCSTASPSSIPKVVPVIEGLDKVVHFVMYFVLTLALFMEVPQTKNTKRYLWVLAFPIVYGGAIELIQQYFFPPRTGDFFDFLANLLGVLTAYLAGQGLAKISIIKKRLRY